MKYSKEIYEIAKELKDFVYAQRFTRKLRALNHYNTNFSEHACILIRQLKEINSQPTHENVNEFLDHYEKILKIINNLPESNKKKAMETIDSLIFTEDYNCFNN